MKPKFQGCYHFLIDLEKGKYSTPISYTHPYLPTCEKENTQLQSTLPILSHQRKVTKTLVKFTVLRQNFIKSLTLNHKAVKKTLLFSKGLLTTIYFAKYLMSGFPGKHTHTHTHTHTHNYKVYQKTENRMWRNQKISNSDMAEILE